MKWEDYPGGPIAAGLRTVWGRTVGAILAVTVGSVLAALTSSEIGGTVWDALVLMIFGFVLALPYFIINVVAASLAGWGGFGCTVGVVVALVLFCWSSDYVLETWFVFCGACTALCGFFGITSWTGDSAWPGMMWTGLGLVAGYAALRVLPIAWLFCVEWRRRRAGGPEG